MFREMRRKRQQMSLAETIEILEKGSVGVLSVYGDDDRFDLSDGRGISGSSSGNGRKRFCC